MIYASALAAWVVMAAAETILGILRTRYLSRRVGDFKARQIGLVVDCAVILLIVYLSIDQLDPQRTHLWRIGFLWLALSLAFEVFLGRFVLKMPWKRLASDFDLLHGGLMPIGMALLTSSPWIAVFLKHK